MPDQCQTRTDTVPAPVPWKRLPDESSKAYGAFCCYVMIGTRGRTRSLKKVAKELHRGVGASWLKEWSARYDWVERARAYDDEQRRVEMAYRDRDERVDAAANRVVDNALVACLRADPEKMTPANARTVLSVVNNAMQLEAMVEAKRRPLDQPVKKTRQK